MLCGICCKSWACDAVMFCTKVSSLVPFEIIFQSLFLVADENETLIRPDMIMMNPESQVDDIKCARGSELRFGLVAYRITIPELRD